MKYSFTIRLINAIMFTILGAGLGFVGIYFGFVTGPFLWSGAQPAGVDLPQIGLGLAGMLGAVGIAGLLVCIYGLVTSILSIVASGNDKLVVKSFNAYIMIGYVLSAFFLLNAAWLYRLTSSNLGDNDLAFIIIVYIILFILSLIASNVPLVKLYGEGEDTNGIMGVITGALIAADASLALVFGTISCVTRGSVTAYADVIANKTGTVALVGIVGGILAVLAYLGYNAARKHNVYVKRNGLLFEGALLINGVGIILSGVWGYVYREKAAAIMAAKVYAKYASMTEFLVMSCIVGGVIVLASLILCYFTLFPSKGKKAN